MGRSAKSVAEFCDTYGITRRTFENWQVKGVAPAITQPIPGGRKLISQQSEEEWKLTHTAGVTDPKSLPTRIQQIFSLKPPRNKSRDPVKVLRDMVTQVEQDIARYEDERIALMAAIEALEREDRAHEVQVVKHRE